MKTYKFYGHSDDNFCYDCTDGNSDEQDNCGANEPIIWSLVSEKEGRVLVVGRYAPLNACGCWSVGLCPVDEDISIPPWPVKFKLSERGYSAELSIDVPDDTKIENKTK